MREICRCLNSPMNPFSLTHILRAARKATKGLVPEVDPLVRLEYKDPVFILEESVRFPSAGALTVISCTARRHVSPDGGIQNSPA
jgi:hypothetical protein